MGGISRRSGMDSLPKSTHEPVAAGSCPPAPFISSERRGGNHDGFQGLSGRIRPEFLLMSMKRSRLTAASYGRLYQPLAEISGTHLGWSLTTLREKLIKIGAKEVYRRRTDEYALLCAGSLPRRLPAPGQNPDRERQHPTVLARHRLAPSMTPFDFAFVREKITHPPLTADPQDSSSVASCRSPRESANHLSIHFVWPTSVRENHR